MSWTYEIRFSPNGGALRMGAGLVTIGCPAGVHDILEVKCTEAMTAPLPDTDARALAASAEQGILALAATRDAPCQHDEVQLGETGRPSWATTSSVYAKDTNPLAMWAKGAGPSNDLGWAARWSAGCDQPQISDAESKAGSMAQSMPATWVVGSRPHYE